MQLQRRRSRRPILIAKQHQTKKKAAGKKGAATSTSSIKGRLPGENISKGRGITNKGDVNPSMAARAAMKTDEQYRQSGIKQAITKWNGDVQKAALWRTS